MTTHFADFVKSFLFLCFLIIFNLFVSTLNYRYDFTDQKIFSLSAKTKEFIKSIDQPVSIYYAYDIRNRVLKDAANTLRLFANESEKLRLEIFDPVIEPSLAEKHGIRFAGTAVVRSGDRRVEINLFDEVSFVNGLIQVVSNSRGKICFTTGHLESDPFSMQTHDHYEGGSHNHTFGGKPLTIHEKHGMGEAYNSLITLGFAIEKLFLAKQSDSINDCLVMVIASPQREFMQTEVETIKKYLTDGGNLLLMLEPGVDTGLKRILTEYGVSWKLDFIYDEYSHLRADKYAIAVTRYPKHKITRDLALTVFPGAVALEPEIINGNAEIKPSFIPLIQTSGRAGSERVKDLNDQKLIGLIVKSKANSSTIAILGDGDFATNSFYDVGDNGRLFTRLINELAEIENVLQLEPKSYKQDVLSLTSKQASVLFLTATLALPIIFLMLGIYVFFRSRV
ncbi:MAG: hypothetical protein CBC29_08445 [Methylococcaceae bacterium TMED69]|nr:MAG: hypothetical protein CBC29_08445 [Methylococcaceae bacterium TMED69]